MRITYLDVTGAESGLEQRLHSRKNKIKQNKPEQKKTKQTKPNQNKTKQSKSKVK